MDGLKWVYVLAAASLLAVGAWLAENSAFGAQSSGTRYFPNMPLVTQDGEPVDKDIFFYSICVNPERDTPAVLKAYA